MSQATAFLGDIVTRARKAERKMSTPEGRQACVEIRLAAEMAIEGEKAIARKSAPLRTPYRSKD